MHGENLQSFSLKRKNYDEKDLLLIAPCTSPLRRLETPIGIIEKLKKVQKLMELFVLKKSNVLPDFNLLKKNQDNYLNIYLNSKRKVNRQIIKSSLGNDNYCLLL